MYKNKKEQDPYKQTILSQLTFSQKNKHQINKDNSIKAIIKAKSHMTQIDIDRYKIKKLNIEL